MRNIVDTPKIWAIQLAAAVDNAHGVGASLVCRGAFYTDARANPTPNAPPASFGGGLEICRIRIQPVIAVPTDGLVRFFLEQQGSKYLMHEQPLTAGTKPTYHGQSYDDVPLGPLDLRAVDFGGPWPLKVGDAIFASCTIASPVNIIAVGGDYGIDLGMWAHGNAMII